MGLSSLVVTVSLLPGRSLHCDFDALLTLAVYPSGGLVVYLGQVRGHSDPLHAARCGVAEVLAVADLFVAARSLTYLSMCINECFLRLRNKCHAVRCHSWSRAWFRGLVGVVRVYLAAVIFHPS